MCNKQIKGMYAAGKIAAEALEVAKKYANIGTSTAEIDRQCQKYIESMGAKAECIGYQGYKHATCTSLTDVACHGVPSEHDILKNGDMLNVDLVVRYNNFLADTSTTILIGNVDPILKELTEAAEDAMYIGMCAIKLGSPVCNIGNAIQNYIDAANSIRPINQRFGLTSYYAGHGIGEVMHESPSVQHCANNDQTKLQAYKAFTIEPIVTLGTNPIFYEETDGWTIRTKNRNPVTQFEHTIAFDDEGKLHIFTTLNLQHETELLSKLPIYRSLLKNHELRTNIKKYGNIS